MNGTLRIVAGTVFGSVAGFLTRPCCVIPAGLSVLGMSTAGLAHVLVAYRPVLVSSSAIIVAASLWITFRREGGWLAKMLAAGAMVTAFALSATAKGSF